MGSENLPKPWSPFVLDLTGDGEVTISDLTRWAAEAFFLPGDWSIWALARYAPGLARFLELDADAYGGVISGFVSAFSWLALLLGIIIVYQSIRRFDDALTMRVRQAYVEGRRRARIAWASLRYRLRSGKPAVPEPQIEFSETLELAPAQLKVLRAALDVEPPYALALGEIASEIGVSRREAERLLEGLIELELLSTAFGGGDGESAYTITPSGRAYLIFKQLAPRS